MAVVSLVVVAPDESSAAAALTSVREQTGVELEVILSLPADAAPAPAGGQPLPGLRVERAPKGASPGRLRNQALAAATAPYVCVLEAGETLASPDALARQVAALEADPAAVCSHGRTDVVEASGVMRARPARGRGGWVLRRLVQHKSLIASSASVVWRRSLLKAAAYDESYRTPQGLLLALSLDESREHPFLFAPFTVARAPALREDHEYLEEQVKIFVALLYGATKLDERLEARVRFRLARALVGLGKHHYRKGDHARAGKLFGEAVRAVPSYFKGRRYQFMNFLKGVLARGT